MPNEQVQAATDEQVAVVDSLVAANAVRAMRVSLNRLPAHVDRNNAREVLEFVTCSSYPTARDPLLAVAHAAAQIILAMHDEIHAAVAARREDTKRIAELTAECTSLTDFIDRNAEVTVELSNRVTELERIVGPVMACGCYAIQCGPVFDIHDRLSRLICPSDQHLGMDVTPEYLAWRESR